MQNGKQYNRKLMSKNRVLKWKSSRRHYMFKEGKLKRNTSKTLKTKYLSWKPGKYTKREKKKARCKNGESTVD